MNLDETQLDIYISISTIFDRIEVIYTKISIRVFTFRYGMAFGNEKTMNWLINIGLSIGSSVFVVQPLQIIVISLFVAFYLKKKETTKVKKAEVQSSNEEYINQVAEYVESKPRKAIIGVNPIDSNQICGENLEGNQSQFKEKLQKGKQLKSHSIKVKTAASTNVINVRENEKKQKQCDIPEIIIFPRNESNFEGDVNEDLFASEAGPSSESNNNQRLKPPPYRKNVKPQKPSHSIEEDFLELRKRKRLTKNNKTAETPSQKSFEPHKSSDNKTDNSKQKKMKRNADQAIDESEQGEFEKAEASFTEKSSHVEQIDWDSGEAGGADERKRQSPSCLSEVNQNREIVIPEEKDPRAPLTAEEEALMRKQAGIKRGARAFVVNLMVHFVFVAAIAVLAQSKTSVKSSNAQTRSLNTLFGITEEENGMSLEQVYAICCLCVKISMYFQVLKQCKYHAIILHCNVENLAILFYDYIIYITIFCCFYLSVKIYQSK